MSDFQAILLELPDELVGDRVIVRPYRAGDGAAIWEAVEQSRAQLRVWLPWVDRTREPSDSEAYARRSLANWILRADLSQGIFERSTGRFLGGSGLHRLDWTARSTEIGYWLRGSAEGQGFMSETVKLLLDLAFGRLEARRVEIRCAVDNRRSRAVPERLGFVREGILRNALAGPEGESRDVAVYALTREDRIRRGESNPAALAQRSES